MSPPDAAIADLPDALEDFDDFERRIAGRSPAVFLDYDGTLTPIVDRPEDARIDDAMRAAVRGLAERCTVCVVSGRDRAVVQELMGVDDLVVAGSHGFDIWSPHGGAVQHDAGAGSEELVRQVTERLREGVTGIDGALVEPKKVSVAVHYRLVAEEAGRERIARLVEEILAERPGELKVTPGKMVYELQPAIDWDKGKAVLHLLAALDLDSDDVVALYLGDDHTDEHAFAALGGRGIGIFVGSAEDPEVAGRTTSADYVIGSVEEVRTFLDRLAR